MIKFGPSGSCEEFKAQNFKKLTDGIPWLKEKGIDCFEYSFGRGVNISEDTAISTGNAFKAANIEMSVHAPYFINLATIEEEKKNNNINYIMDSLQALKWFQGNRVVFHPGSPCKLERREAMNVLLKAFEKIVEIKHERGYDDLLLCPETMGKGAQLGDLDEIIEIVNHGDKSIVPCIDFGHLNARDCGGIKTKDDYRRIIDKLIDKIGFEKAEKIHVHFSKIEYTGKGEVRHLTFDDTKFGPEFEPLMEIFKEYKMNPYVICESSGTQTRDSMLMKNYYNSLN